eukprot:1656834-Pyramimonas_sp.AAC.1
MSSPRAARLKSSKVREASWSNRKVRNVRAMSHIPPRMHGAVWTKIRADLAAHVAQAGLVGRACWAVLASQPRAAATSEL